MGELCLRNVEFIGETGPIDVFFPNGNVTISVCNLTSKRSFNCNLSAKSRVLMLLMLLLSRINKDYRAGKARKMGSSAHKLKLCGQCCHLAAGVFKHVRTAAEAIN